MFVCFFLRSRVEDLAGEAGLAACSSGQLTLSAFCGGLCGLHCDVLQHPGRRPPGGQPGALHSLPPRRAGLELPLHAAAGRNPEMGAGCETSVFIFLWIAVSFLPTPNKLTSFI